jgi:rubredoxin
MTLHIYSDHRCSQCEARYVPYDKAVPCPRCGLVEESRFDFVPRAVSSARINLREQGSYQPAAWAVSCYADHLMMLLFMILERHRKGVPRRPFDEVARECVETMDWGDQPYGKQHLYGMALRVHEELERLRARREKSFFWRAFRWFLSRAPRRSFDS